MDFWNGNRIMIYLDICSNISMHKGKYYIVGTKKALKEATEFKDDSLYESGTDYLGKSKITAKAFTLPAKNEGNCYEVICPSKELLDNFYKIDFKVFYCPNYINDQLFIDKGEKSDINSAHDIYIPRIRE